MNSMAPIEKLVDDIRALGNTQSTDIEQSIELYLEQEFRPLSYDDKLSVLESLAQRFASAGSEPAPGLNVEAGDASRILSLILGSKVAATDISNKEVSEKFAHSLNTIFDALNQIIAVIHTNLLGQKPELETIRQIIGSQIGGASGESSLITYLSQIQLAFLVAHKAFQQSALAIVHEILSAIDPETLTTSMQSSYKFGPLRKAELFDIYQEKFQECKKWVDSGQFNEKLLRDFEKICQKTYKT